LKNADAEVTTKTKGLPKIAPFKYEKNARLIDDDMIEKNLEPGDIPKLGFRQRTVRVDLEALLRESHATERDRATTMQQAQDRYRKLSKIVKPEILEPIGMILFPFSYPIPERRETVGPDKIMDLSEFGRKRYPDSLDYEHRWALRMFGAQRALLTLTEAGFKPEELEPIRNAIRMLEASRQMQRAISDDGAREEHNIFNISIQRKPRECGY
jgi:hypothetical protein